MTTLKNPMEIFKLLPRTDCRDCGAATCLAFSVLVFKGEKRLADCPHLDSALAQNAHVTGLKAANADETLAAGIAALKKKVPALDFAQAAPRLGATVAGDRLAIRCLGKNFQIDSQGNIHTDIHVNNWLLMPLLDYVLNAKGAEPAGQWVPFVELAGGRELNPLFMQRCEIPIKEVADRDSDLFFDLLGLFSGRELTDGFHADRSVVLYPLPKVPMVVAYSFAEEGFESTLRLLFDRQVEENLHAESLRTLATGVARMIRRLVRRHGFPESFMKHVNR
ncbi:MAG: DUF3786 domain-containing protein [Desulfobacterales bacterium]|nr:DUF3786 domain-containing protein [Desulfobacterales bacterium]